jgi:hypothetical protein
MVMEAAAAAEMMAALGASALAPSPTSSSPPHLYLLTSALALVKRRIATKNLTVN